MKQMAKLNTSIATANGAKWVNAAYYIKHLLLFILKLKILNLKKSVIESIHKEVLVLTLEHNQYTLRETQVNIYALWQGLKGTQHNV